MKWILLLLVAASVVAVLRARRHSQLHLVSDEIGNEVLLLRSRIGGCHGLFMVDTAYAGAPVLSTSYLATAPRRAYPSITAEYRASIAALSRKPSEGERLAAINAFLRRAPCRAYTSGCTMRLMGIGTTSETQSDMLLCPPIRVAAETETADVFVTNPLPTSVHILTMDYLMHRAPCVLLPAQQKMMWSVVNPAMRATFEFFVPRLVGGAARIPMSIGGATLQIVVDTGAAAALSLAADSFERVSSCENRQKSALQRGVNGERICSTVVHADVSVGRVNLGSVEVFVNSTNVEGADGYAGMGLLRALDLWIAPRELGVRRSGLAPKGSGALRDGACETSFRCPGK